MERKVGGFYEHYLVGGWLLTARDDYVGGNTKG